MSEAFVAEIRIFPFNFAPTGWAFCNGQIIPISQNTALFSLLGTTYGGDGKATFALPNLQGSTPMHWGQGPGLSLRDLGELGGEDNLALLDAEMPAHAHSLNAHTIDPADTNIPSANASFAVSTGGKLYQSGSPNVQMSFNTLSIAGGGLPHNNLQPYLTLNFCIALQGVFPPCG